MNLRERHHTLGLAGMNEGPGGNEVNTAAVHTCAGVLARTPGSSSYARDTFPGVCVRADSYSFTPLSILISSMCVLCVHVYEPQCEKKLVNN